MCPLKHYTNKTLTTLVFLAGSSQNKQSKHSINLETMKLYGTVNLALQLSLAFTVADATSTLTIVAVDIDEVCSDHPMQLPVFPFLCFCCAYT